MAPDKMGRSRGIADGCGIIGRAAALASLARNGVEKVVDLNVPVRAHVGRLLERSARRSNEEFAAGSRLLKFILVFAAQYAD